MDKALKHFKNSDPILYSTAIKIKLNENEKSQDLPDRQAGYFIDLIESIISQQLSVKASDTIFGRFKKLFPKEYITPVQVLKIPDEKIRECGISYSKIKYIKGIAAEIKNKNLKLKDLDTMTDEEVILELTKLKGVGKWTAEMFLMFTLNREDVFSTGDLGLQNAIIKLYNLKGKPSQDQLVKISEKWTPHRTVASRILWRSLEL